MKPFVRTPYNYDMALASDSSGTDFTGVDSLTRQADAGDADINVIVRRFGITGALPQVAVPPSYQSFRDIFDFQSAANTIRAAQESFNGLDADTRARFANDPARFVDFCSAVDAEGNLVNLAEMRKMNLALPEEPAIVPPSPVKVEIVNPQPTAPK